MTQSLASIPKGVKQRADPLPKIQNAGKIIASGGHTAEMSIKAELYPHDQPGNPGTPDHIKKYRKTNNIQPGQIVVHPGLQEGKFQPPTGYIFGRKTQFSEPVNQTIKAQNLNGLAAQFVEMKERKYASNIREPLGMGYSRQYQWPDKVNNDLAFGVPLEIIKDQAKMAIYPAGGSLEEKGDVARMYQKTHGNWGPG